MSSRESGFFFCGISERAAGDAVAEFEPAEFVGGVEDPVFGEAREVRHADGGGGEVVEHEVAVGGDVHAVAGDAVEAELGGQRLRGPRGSLSRPGRRSLAAS